MFASLFLITLLIVSLLVSFFALYFALKRRFTKAKFAFMSFSALGSLSLLIVSSIFAKESPIQSVTRIIYTLLEKEYIPTSPNSIELVAICFVTFLLHNTSKDIFLNWDGPISVEDKKREVQRKGQSLFSDAFREANRIFNHQPAPPLYEPSVQSTFIEEAIPPEDSLAWYEHARELFLLRNPSFEFHIENGWHEQESCWVGQNIRTQECIYLGCSISKPTSENINKFSKYIKRHCTSETTLASSHYWVYRDTDPSWEVELQAFNIDCLSEESLLDKLVDFSDYYYDVVRRAEKDYMPNSEITLKDVYVESFCVQGLSDDKEIPMPVEEILKTWEDDPSSQHIALLGEYGQGKSTLALMFAYHQIVNSEFSPRRIPIVIELRGKAPSTMSSDELLAAWSVRFRINPIALKKLVIAGRVLLIFDGFDEMAFIAQGDARISHFRSLWQFAYPKSKILITGRPNFFLDDAEMRSALGIRQDLPGRANCRALYLKPFNLIQIAEALRVFKKPIINEIESLALRSQRFYDLASRPCLLYIIGVLWEGKRDELSKQSTSASVIDMFITYSLDRQESKAKSGGRFMVLETPERAYFMEGIAACMLSNYLPNQIPIATLREATLTLLESIPESVSFTSNAMMPNGVQSLRRRIGDDDTMIDALHTDIRTYGLIVNDPTQAGTMRFAHKSFMEYLGAKVLARGSFNPEDDANHSLINTFDLSINSVIMSKEITGFFAETVASEINDEVATDSFEIANKLFLLLNPRPILRNVIVPTILRIEARRLSRRLRHLEEAITKDSDDCTISNRDEILEHLKLFEPYRPLLDKLGTTFNTFFPAYPLFILRLAIGGVTSFSSSGFSSWIQCCSELGISPEVMGEVTHHAFTPYFQCERLMSAHKLGSGLDLPSYIT